MAALLISSFFPTNGVADCYSGNHQGKNHHELREHLKVTHDSVPPFTFVERCEGKAKSQAPSVVLQAMEPFHRLRDYYIMSNYTSQAFRTTFQHVRFGGGRRGDTLLLGRFMFVYACCLPQRAKQDGLRDRAFLFRVGRNRHSCVLMMLCGHRTLHVHFGIARFFPAIPTGCDRSLLYEKERRFALAFLLL